MLGRLDHATGHVIQRRQQGGDDLVADALGGQLQLVERVVEVARLCGGVGGQLQSQFSRLLLQRTNALPPLIEEGDHFRTGFAEDIDRQRCFLRAIGHGLEAVGQILQYLFAVA